jgi:hypothetical protein
MNDIDVGAPFIGVALCRIRAPASALGAINADFPLRSTSRSASTRTHDDRVPRVAGR